MGYPSEHLGKANADTLSSPMYATSVGLVLKAHEAMMQKSRRMPPKKTTVRGGSSDRSSLFDRLIQKGQAFFSDDDL
jgi:hypothetical protein